MRNYIIRKNKGKSHIFFDKRNNRIKNKKYIKKCLENLYLPPAYDNVKINLNKKAKVLAIGYDDKNRSQYIYNKKYTEKMKKKKFNKLYLFGLQYDKIINDINKNIKLPDDNKLKHICMILKLIIDCDFRVGNDEYLKQNNSHGVTTLKSKHIIIKNDEVIIDFIGKKSVRNICKVKNKTIKKHLKKMKKTLKNNKRIFSYKNENLSRKVNIKSTDVNNYIKQFGDFSSKDFRTWSANIKLIEYLLKSDLETDDKNIKDCVIKVADKLHHTPEVCKKNYLFTELIDFYKDEPVKFKKFFLKNINKKFTLFLKNN
jgi:DNA topoisomerase I